MTSPAALVPVVPVFTNTEHLALAGFLAGYSGLTRQAYELDLRQYASWCHQHHLCLFQARRADIECCWWRGLGDGAWGMRPQGGDQRCSLMACAAGLMPYPAGSRTHPRRRWQITWRW